MPSAALLQWQNDRLPRLNDIEAQCAAALAAIPLNPRLVEEDLRGCVVSLSAHFQGYCRDLYMEAIVSITTRIRPSLQVLVQKQFTAQCALDHGNPNYQNLKKDFNRFQFSLDLAADPLNVPRLQDLAALNEWRNVAAHQGPVIPAVGPLSLALLQNWRTSCDGLAISLYGIMYNQLRSLLRRKPW
jgi:hypothetical protein